MPPEDDGTARGCLDENDLAALAERRLEVAELRRFEVHLDVCGTCRRLVAEVARSLELPGAPSG